MQKIEEILTSFNHDVQGGRRDPRPSGSAVDGDNLALALYILPRVT